MHPMNYSAGKIEVYRLDGLVDEYTGEFMHEGERYVPGLATALQNDPTRAIISAVDLEAWVASLPDADQELLALRQAGSTLKESASKLNLSISAVWARLKKLGLALSDRAGIAIAGTNPSAA